MIIADCTVLARLLIRADPTDRVDTLLATDPDWHAPDLWRPEFASVLRKYERARLLAPATADALTGRACALLAHSTHCVPLSRLMEVSRRTGCTAYDSAYLALAEDLGCKLYTYDAEVLTRCPKLAVQP